MRGREGGRREQSDGSPTRRALDLRICFGERPGCGLHPLLFATHTPKQPPGWAGRTTAKQLTQGVAALTALPPSTAPAAL